MREGISRPPIARQLLPPCWVVPLGSSGFWAHIAACDACALLAGDRTPAFHQNLTNYHLTSTCSVLYFAHLARSRSGGDILQNLRSRMAKTCCPQCDAAIRVDRPRAGAMVVCRRCNTELEIISINPLVVDFTLDYGQEWRDEWDDEDDRRAGEPTHN